MVLCGWPVKVPGELERVLCVWRDASVGGMAQGPVSVDVSKITSGRLSAAVGAEAGDHPTQLLRRDRQATGDAEPCVSGDVYFRSGTR